MPSLAGRRAEQDEKERQFRERREKLLALFNIARLRGYRIDAEWVGAVESFDADGWREILALRSREAGMGRVLDQWIAIRYGLEKVRDASMARAALKRIWEDDRSTLMRPVIERAVEMVAPQLDDPDFIAYASKAIAGKDVERSEDDKSSTAIDLGDLLKTMMILDRWMDDRDEKAGGKKQPNPVETDFVPALLRRGWDPVNAARMGGPVVEKYLLRQNWRQEVNKHGPNSEWLGMPGHVNKWLRAAAWLSGPKGREFRVREEHRILRFVRKVLSANGSPELDKHLGFLYLDADRGERSLGMKAWPEILARDWFAGRQLGTPWKYLVKMEPRPTVEMYVDAWRSALRGTNYNSYWSHFDLLNALPSEKRRQVFEGVIATARKKYMPDDKNGMGNHYLSAAERHVYLDDAQLFDELRRAQSLKDVAPDLYRDFQITAESATRNLSGVKVFGFTDADVRAASGNPRLLIPQIALHRATPGNREALNALLDDPDEEIQAAAEEVKKVLEILRARNPKDFAIKGE